MLGAEIRKTSQKELIAEFEQTAKSIKETNLLIPNKTLDNVLDEPIEGMTRTGGPNEFNRLRGGGPGQQSRPYFNNRSQYGDRNQYNDQNRQQRPYQRRESMGGRQGLTDRDE